MRKHLNLIAAAALAVGGFTFVGCDDGVDDDVNTNTTPRTTNDNTVKDDLNRAGDKIESGAEKTGEALERGAEKTGEAMKEAGRDLRDGADRAEDKIDNAVTPAPTTRPVSPTVND